MQAGWYSENEGLHLTSDLDIPGTASFPFLDNVDHSTRNGTAIEIEEQTEDFLLSLTNNDVADRTSYARSLSQSALTSAASDVDSRLSPERVIVEDNIRTNPLISKIPFLKKKIDSNQDKDTQKETIVGTSKVFSYEAFIGRTWALVVVSVAVFGACVSLWMLVYVFIKMCDGTLAGSNQTMGVLLLVGVTCLFAR